MSDNFYRATREYIKNELFGYRHTFYPHKYKIGDLVWIKKLKRPGFIKDIDPFSMLWHYTIEISPGRNTYWSNEDLIGMSIRKHLAKSYGKW